MSEKLTSAPTQKRATSWFSALKNLPLSGKIGGAIVLLVVAVALLSLVWTPYDPYAVSAADRLQHSSFAHPMGTDRFGRDVLSQIMVGSRITLIVGLVAVSVAAIVGVPLGIWAAMKKGAVESIIMRGSDLLLAFPGLLLAIVATAMFGASTITAMIAIGIASIPAFARISRAATLSVLSRDFISASYIAGKKPLYVATHHILPNISAVIIVEASVSFALAILAEAGLSFLGLGTPPPTPSWGRMLQSAQASLATAPELALWPGLAIAITVLGFNLLGDGLRDAADPRHREGKLS